MKNKIAFILLCLLPLLTWADLVTEGEVNHQFTILNLDEFPEYEFYVNHQNYFYERGYQPGTVEEVAVTQGEHFLTGARYSTSPLFARMKGENEAVAESSIQLGGKEVVPQRDADYILDVYKIKSISEGKIKLEKVDQRLMLKGGGEIKMKKGEISTGIQVLGIDLIYIALPVVCLLGLVFFFIYRRRSRNGAA